MKTKILWLLATTILVINTNSFAEIRSFFTEADAASYCPDPASLKYQKIEHQFVDNEGVLTGEKDGMKFMTTNYVNQPADPEHLNIQFQSVGATYGFINEDQIYCFYSFKTDEQDAIAFTMKSMRKQTNGYPLLGK